MIALAARGAARVGLCLAAVGAAAAQAQPADGLYTNAQADRGEALYKEQCVVCHGALTQITPDMAALLADHTFRARWTGRSLGELFELIQVEMPQDAPGSLSARQTTDLLAYILRGNKRPAGDAPLAEDAVALDEIPFDPAQ